MEIIGAHNGQGDARCADHIDSSGIDLPVYEGQELHCTYCGDAWMPEPEGEITEADVNYIGRPPHPHDIVPGTMGAHMRARQRRIREVARDRNMTPLDVMNAYRSWHA